MRKAIEQIRGFFAARSDPYAGGDLGNAQRLGAVLWGLVLALTILLLPLSPPDEAIGDAGWLIAGGLLIANLALIVALRRGLVASWGPMLAAAYGGIAGIALIQWLAGGVEAPYDRLLLLPILFGSALHPPRRIAVLMVVALAALAAPLVYDGWSSQEAGAAGAVFVIWCALATMVNLLMSGVRAQRLTYEQQQAEARSEARQDALTALPNRRAFDETIEHEVERARRLRLPLSMAMVDIENFKEINDRWGYAEGDRCLREVAESLRGAVRRPDLCFRWGGDEFAVILAGTAVEDTIGLGQRLCRAIADNCDRPDDEPIRARCASAELHVDQTAADLVERAGLALTEAKIHS
jgi:diguanylate cyclase (GGDEF)-like protein